MPVPTTIADLSTTAASNYPQGSDSPSTLDDVQRAHGAFIAQVRDGAHVPSATAKTTPVDADLIPINDSAASNLIKKLTYANLKATLKTYFDTVYGAIGTYAAAGANTDITSLGTVTTTTQAASDASTKLATTAFVNSTGRVVQTVEATPYVTYTSTAVFIPWDDTIPQNTEGLQILTVSITPKNVANRLRVEWDFMGAASTSAGHISAALFQDSAANALAVRSGGGDSSQIYCLPGSYEAAAGTTSATTFKLNFGVDTGTAYVNGNSSGRKFGGASAARLRVTELAA